MKLGRGALWLLLAGCIHLPPPQPAWPDDSRSELAAQGTTVDPQKEPAPPEAATAPPPEPALVPASVAAPLPTAEDDAPMPADGPVVRLLDAGAEPRVRLRYRLAGPQTEDMTMNTAMSVSTNLGPLGATEMPTPGMRMLASVTSAPAGKGELTSTMQVMEADAVSVAGVPPGLTEKMAAELRKLRGTTIQSRLTTRGAVIKAETTLPPDAPASSRGTLDSMQGSNRGAVLPAEAVGVGARWETETRVQQNGVDVHQVSRFRVRELAGTRVGLDVELEVSASAQEIKIPNGNGATAQLESLNGTGTGTLDLDLGSLVPRRSHATIDSQMSMKLPMAGRLMPVSTRMKMVMDLHAGR